MYVPFEHAIRIFASGRPKEEVSATLMREEADFTLFRASAETPRTKIFSPEKRSKKFCPTPDADAAYAEAVIPGAPSIVIPCVSSSVISSSVSSSVISSGVEKSASSRINVADTSSLGLPEARIRIACSKGTYIRAFARDLGEALGTGAHLSGLVRTRTGDFRLEDALSLETALSLLAE